jgi:hypothetical protein
MQASPDAIATYSLAFLILIIYIVDTIVDWYYHDKSWKYFFGQIFVVLLFVIPEIILVIYDQEAKPAILHGLQGMCLLQGLVTEVRVFQVYIPVANNRDRLRCARGCTLALQPSSIIGDISLGFSRSSALLC